METNTKRSNLDKVKQLELGTRREHQNHEWRRAERDSSQIMWQNQYWKMKGYMKTWELCIYPCIKTCSGIKITEVQAGRDVGYQDLVFKADLEPWA